MVRSRAIFVGDHFQLPRTPTPIAKPASRTYQPKQNAVVRRQHERTSHGTLPSLLAIIFQLPPTIVTRNLLLQLQNLLRGPSSRRRMQWRRGRSGSTKKRRMVPFLVFVGDHFQLLSAAVTKPPLPLAKPASRTNQPKQNAVAKRQYERTSHSNISYPLC